jgi:hypothetical protein
VDDRSSYKHGNSFSQSPRSVSVTSLIFRLLLQNFEKRFKSIPNITELDHLTVSGDVWFGKGVRLAGTCIIVANEGNKIMIPDGTSLENKLVTGNLNIIDH